MTKNYKLISWIIIQIFFVVSNCHGLASKSQVEVVRHAKEYYDAKQVYKYLNDNYPSYNQLNFSVSKDEIVCFFEHKNKRYRCVYKEGEFKVRKYKNSVLTQRPFSRKIMKDMNGLGDEWKSFVKWMRKLSFKIFCINFLFGVSSFVIMFVLVVFISAGNVPFYIACIWIGFIFINLILRVIFDRNNQVMYEKITYKLDELIKNEYLEYNVLKVADKNRTYEKVLGIAPSLMFWKLSENYIVDFFMGLLGGFVAIAILNPIYLIPYSVVLLIVMGVILYWTLSKEAGRQEYKKQKDVLSERNKILTQVGLKSNVEIWNGKIEKEFNKYTRKKSVVNILLRGLIMGVIPLIGVVLFFGFGYLSAILLFYIFALNLFGIFGLLDFFTSSHRGVAYKRDLDSFLTELNDSNIIINNATWEKKRVGEKDINIFDVNKLSLDKFCLDIENGDVHVFLDNERIDLNVGGVSMLCGQSGAGKTSIMQFLGAKLFLNEFKVTQDNYFGAQGDFFLEGSKDKIKILPDNLSYESLQELVCYHSFDDIENFNFDIDILPKDIKNKFLKYAEIMIDDLHGKVNGNWSSGERSRVKLALILAVNKSKFVLLDQVLVNLDEKTAYKVMSVIKEYSEKQKVGFLVSDPKRGYNYSGLLDEVIMFDSSNARLVHEVQDGSGLGMCA